MQPSSPKGARYFQGSWIENSEFRIPNSELSALPCLGGQQLHGAFDGDVHDAIGLAHPAVAGEQFELAGVELLELLVGLGLDLLLHLGLLRVEEIRLQDDDDHEQQDRGDDANHCRCGDIRIVITHGRLQF